MQGFSVAMVDHDARDCWLKTAKLLSDSLAEDDQIALDTIQRRDARKMRPTLKAECFE
jgi:hypothetical protein